MYKFNKIWKRIYYRKIKRLVNEKSHLSNNDVLEQKAFKMTFRGL